MNTPCETCAYERMCLGDRNPDEECDGWDRRPTPDDVKNATLWAIIILGFTALALGRLWLSLCN